MLTKKKVTRACLAVFLLAGMAACGPQAPQAVEATSTLPAQTTAVEPTATDTAEPTAPPTEEPTPEPTLEPTLEPSPEPSETPAPPSGQPVSATEGNPLPEGFNAWCLPKGVYDQGSVASNGAMPPLARPAVMKNGKPDLIIEAQSCIFVYTFDQPIEPGTQLVIHDTLDAPFVKVELTPIEEDPNTGYAMVTHGSLVDAQVWTIDFRVAVEDPNGVEIRSEMMAFERGWRPQPCYGGVWPNPATGRCPEMGEAHPWDPWYGYSQYGGYNEGVTTPGPIMDPPWADD